MANQEYFLSQNLTLLAIVAVSLLFAFVGILYSRQHKGLENTELGTIKGNFIKKQSIGSSVQLLIQPEDLEHDDKSNLKLEVVDRKFRGTNFIYTLKTMNNQLIPVFVHSHHEHQHKIKDKFGIKRPIYIDHLVCF